MHSESEAAIEFSDGYSLWALNGIAVHEWVIKKELITPALINNEPNAEVRRLAIERYGWSNYFKDSNAILVDESLDKKGNPRRLWKKDLGADFTEPVFMVELTNSSYEGLYRQGTDIFDFHLNENGEKYYKTYMFRVPPTMKTALQAQLWHMGIEEDPTTVNVLQET